ncbi:molecular chaperone [Erwinia sp. HR93]|uniref:fimbrial biogenesis chaperone n=1 Tax=Erwinia sp. HR93 TaxID=3094840 RepID=UPI002ADEF925|nr:fimbria/pilus periplasmic chaperone [Erwinia sp. HR93]MEA1065317.1 fimbria/pilus periplasmic chaperone [Erwinia sp. HR93]
MFFKSLQSVLRYSVFAYILASAPTQASIIISGTRVVYAGNEKEVTVKLSNSGKAPVLAQSWIDTGDVDAKPEKINTPFILTPPINRINAGKSQTLRLSYTGVPALPEDKESVYWLNVLEIPPVNKNAAPNRLQVAFRTRIKLFYRPAALADSEKAITAAEKIKWKKVGNTLIAENASPYYVSLVSISLQKNGQSTLLEGEMVAPYGKYEFKLKDNSAIQSGARIVYEYINDWGAIKTVQASL